MIEKLYKEPNWESLLATIFGKFYESIIAGYFVEKGYVVYDRGIAIYLKYLGDLDKINLSKELFNNIKLGDAKILRILNKIRDEINKLERVKKDKPMKRYNPDLVVKKDNKYYIVEAQAWPVWLKRRYRHSKLTWNVILNEGVKIIPGLLARKIRVRGKEVYSSGFFYVSYSRGEDHESIEEFFRRLSGKEFYVLYVVDDIIRSISKEYLDELINRVEKYTVEFLEKIKNRTLDFNIKRSSKYK